MNISLGEKTENANKKKSVIEILKLFPLANLNDNKLLRFKYVFKSLKKNREVSLLCLCLKNIYPKFCLIFWVCFGSRPKAISQLSGRTVLTEWTLQRLKKSSIYPAKRISYWVWCWTHKVNDAECPMTVRTLQEAVFA